MTRRMAARIRLWSLPACLALVSASSCTTSTSNNSGGGAHLNFVKTSIAIPTGAGLVAGDDVIAYGTGQSTGVAYIIPSLTPRVGLTINNSDNYASTGFAVGGKYIFLVGATGGPTPLQVTVYNTQTRVAFPTIAGANLHLGAIPSAQYKPGNMIAQDNYCVTINDPNAVSDGAILKVIDMSGGNPAIVSFRPNIVTTTSDVIDVALEASSKTVVMAGHNDIGDQLFVYNIDAPGDNPTKIYLPFGYNRDTRLVIANGYALTRDNQPQPRLILVNLSTGDITYVTNFDSPTDAFAQANLAMGGTLFLYFANDTSFDTEGIFSRVAIGTVPGPSSTKVALNQFIDGSSAANGLLGFSQTAVIRPDGSLIFLAGQGSIAQGSFLQFSAGDTNFVVARDASGGNFYGLPACDPSISSSTLAFKTTPNNGTGTVVGYSILP